MNKDVFESYCVTLRRTFKILIDKFQEEFDKSKWVWFYARYLKRIQRQMQRLMFNERERRLMNLKK